MNFSQVEKALIEPMFQSIVELSLTNKSKPQSAGTIYTCLNSSEHILQIGYTEQIQTIVEKGNKIGYKMIENRAGTLREKKLLKATLKELGYQAKDCSDKYYFSNQLIRRLQILGWPTGEL